QIYNNHKKLLLKVSSTNSI
ncbi:hypothetical protein A5865_001237, partial [Enterococcus sp. 12E11_DIV0728]